MPRPQLLHELFRYRRRERRAPLEDFLTAALVGFIRTLTKERQLEFTVDVFIAPMDRTLFTDLGRKWPMLRWDLQYTLPNGKRPDIVLWAPAGPVLVVENKIWSGIRVYGFPDNEAPADGDGDEEYDETAQQQRGDCRDQLATYGRWLSNARAASEWPGAITLLTHGTQPPTEFHASNRQAFGATPHVCRWSTICAWLRSHGESGSSSDAVSRYLAGELVSFLEMNGLTMSPLSYGDINALGTYLASRQSLVQAFQETLAALRSTYPTLVAPDRARAFKLENSGPVAYGWVYLQQGGLPPDTFFGWGIRFPRVTGWWREFQDRLPDEEHLFCYFGTDSRALSFHDVAPSVLPDGWLIVDEGQHFLSAAALPELPAAPTLQAAMTQWALERLAKLGPLICHLSD